MSKSSTPNIVFILVDQLTAMAMRYHNKHAVTLTPNLDKMIQHGAVFENAYCPSPLCTPSRYGIMTGQYVKNHKGYDNSALMDSLKPTLAHYARLAGYETILAGKMHFVGSDQLHGYEKRLTTDVYPADFGWVPNWKKPTERIDLWYHNMSSVKQSGVAAISNQLEYDDEVVALAKRQLYQLARREEEKIRPFLLTIGFIHPHDPYVARQRYWDQYNDIEIPLPTTKRPQASDNDPHCLRLETAIGLDHVKISDEDIVRSRRAYFANVTMVDEWVGEILKVLEETNFLENTVLVFSSDHGDFLGERGLWYKMSFYDYASQVPLIFYYPKGIKPQSITTPISLIDLLPTFSDMVGYKGEAIEPLDGHSLFPLLMGKSAVEAQYPQAIITEYCAEGAIEPMMMIRSEKLKYTYAPSDPEQLFHYDGEAREVPVAIDDPRFQKEVAAFRTMAKNHWSAEELKKEIIVNQRSRRIIHEALRMGDYYSWDYQPRRDSSREYIRSQLDLTSFDSVSRYPRPPKFP